MNDKIINLKKQLNEINLKINDKLNQKIVGMVIEHKKFGKGIIIKQKDNTIITKFDTEEKKLQIPFVFINNIVVCDNKEIVQNMKEIDDLLKEKTEIEHLIILEEQKIIFIQSKINKGNIENPDLFVVTSGSSYDDNVAMNIYYCKAERCRKICRYLGLYKDKAVVKIGEIKKVIEAVKVGEKLQYDLIYGEDILEEDIKKIEKCIYKSYDLFNVDISNQRHKYFIVENFYDTDYRKTSPGGLMEHKYFDLCKELKIKELPTIKEIASNLRNIEWE